MIQGNGFSGNYPTRRWIGWNIGFPTVLFPVWMKLGIFTVDKEPLGSSLLILFWLLPGIMDSKFIVRIVNNFTSSRDSIVAKILPAYIYFLKKQNFIKFSIIKIQS